MYKDKEKQAKYQKDWYNRNKKHHISNVRKNEAIYVKRTHSFIVEYLKVHPCVDCGESDIIVLEFDHVRGEKKFNISSVFHNGISLEKIKREIKKCEVRCANCHRKVTNKRGNFYRNSTV